MLRVVLFREAKCKKLTIELASYTSFLLKVKTKFTIEEETGKNP